MGKEKFTPGPWEILGEDMAEGEIPFFDIASGEVGTKTYRAVAHVPAADLDNLSEEDRANAHLIAASPELYEALKRVVDIADRRTVEFDAARAALAKARGEA